MVFAIELLEAAARRCISCVLRNFIMFTGKRLWQFVWILSCRPEACNFIKKVTPVEMLFCEFREIFKKTLFKEHLRATDFAFSGNRERILILCINFFSISMELSLCEKCPNRSYFLVPIFLYLFGIQENTDQKKLRISVHFTQCIIREWITC